MKVTAKYLSIIFLGFILIFFTSCKRNSIEEPDPFGPSTYSIILKVSASPNVIYAGNVRQQTTITASLNKYNGIPLSGKTLYFEIGDADGNKVDVGCFEGNVLIKSKVTDNNGIASTVYYGPLTDEIEVNTNIKIWVTLSSEGEEFITEGAPISIIKDYLVFYLEISGSPNVVFAGEKKREKSTLTAILRKTCGTPMANQKLFFEILNEDGSKANAGFFSGNDSVKYKRTNSSGKASVTYIGPLASELTGGTNIDIYIRATYAQEKSPFKIAENDFVYAEFPIRIIRDITEIDLELTADPNVLNATSKRPKSEIRAVVKKADGAPIIKRKVYFSILSGPGSFSNNKKKTMVKTNKDGVASITFRGPRESEISGDKVITVIRAHLETTTPDYIHKEVDVTTLKNY